MIPLHNKHGVLGINSFPDPPIKIINKSSERVTAMLPDKLFKISSNLDISEREKVSPWTLTSGKGQLINLKHNVKIIQYWLPLN